MKIIEEYGSKGLLVGLEQDRQGNQCRKQLTIFNVNIQEDGLVLP